MKRIFESILVSNLNGSSVKFGLMQTSVLVVATIAPMGRQWEDMLDA